MVPNGWELKKLEDLCRPEAPITYGVLKPGEFYKGGIPLLQIKDLRDGHPLTGDTHLISPALDEEYKRSRILNNDILISLVGTIGRIAKYRDDTAANIHRNIGRIRSDNHEYLFHFLNSNYAQNEIGGSSSGSSQSALNLSTLRSMKIPVPPLPEQKEIAKILSTWDKAINISEQLLANSQQQKKTLLQKLLTGRNRLGVPAGSYELQQTRFGAIPKDWEYPAIKDICTQVSEKNRESINHPVLSCSKHDGFVDSLKYFNKKVYSDDTSDYRLIYRGCFGFPSNHIEEGSIGLQNLYDTGIVSPIYVVFQAKQSKVDNTYLYAVLKTDHYRQIFGAATNASVDRRGSLRWKEFGMIHVPLPPLKEQQKIAAVLSAADLEVTILQQKLDALKQEKKALMQQLFTGKRRVKHNNKEIA